MQQIFDESGIAFEDQGLNSLFHSFKSEKLTKRVENWKKANLLNKTFLILTLRMPVIFFDYSLAEIFKKFPEIPIKNRIRYFLSFNKLVPSFISDLSPIKGYEKYYKIKKGDVIVDAGAYPGDYTIFAGKRVSPNGKVIAFEPDPKNRRILQNNIKKEKLNNIIIVPKGLWSRDAVFSIVSDGLSSSISPEGNIKIEVTTLDSELKRLKIHRVDFIKMDIEGAEIEAIKGCKKTLVDNQLNLAIASYHVINGQQTSYFLEKFLNKEGYFTKSDFKKHLTTYGRKTQRFF